MAKTQTLSLCTTSFSLKPGRQRRQMRKGSLFLQIIKNKVKPKEPALNFTYSTTVPHTFTSDIFSSHNAAILLCYVLLICYMTLSGPAGVSPTHTSQMCSMNLARIAVCVLHCTTLQLICCNC